MMRRAGGLFVALALLAGAVVIAKQQQVRDNAPPPSAAGTASISGKVVVDGPAKQPARRVRVTLTDPSRVFPGQTTTTDDAGSFAFTNLPAGRFEVQAFKTGYLRGSYGASRPERAGTPIVVKNGDALTNLSVTIARGGVISGTVRDTRGRPVPGVSVRVLRFGFNGITGEPTLGAPSGGSSATSDDRGEYRAYGLPPGRYLAMAAPGGSGRAGAAGDDIRVLTSAELQQAMRAARVGGSGGATAAAPPAPLAAPARLSYAPVFHPGVTDIGAATSIALGLSEERTGADITIQFVTTATITGVVTDPSGVLPAQLSVSLVPAGGQAELLSGAGLRGLTTNPGPDGRYAFTGVAPGSYTVKARTGAAGGGRAMTAPTNIPAMWAAADVAISGRDIDVPLTLQRGVAINGRVVFEGSGARPSPADLQTLQFRLVPPASGGQLLSNTGGRVDADGTFTFADIVPDVYQFITQWSATGASGSWSMKSSVANGRDAFDAPLVVGATAAIDWTVTYTDKPSVLSGVLVDRGGRAATDYYILVFPTDRRYWSPGAGLRRIRSMRPGTDGAFSTRGLPPGEYFVGALTDLESGEWNDPAFLEQLVTSSVKVTLREGETTRQDLKIG